MNRYLTRLLSVSLVLLTFTGCQSGLQHLDATEYGVVFRALPPSLGGGVASNVISPGQTTFLWPWESLHRIDTAVKYISWGGRDAAKNGTDYVNTRAVDGNEVALAVTVQYRIESDPAKIRNLVNTFARTNMEVQRIVEAYARADIRTYMNALRTSEFFNRDARYGAISKVQESLNKQLNPHGITVESVILDEHRFERLLPDGRIDTSYQEKIDETQRLGQETERELLRIETVKAKKQQEYNETQATVNREIEEAKGYTAQAKLAADGYYKTKENHSKGIIAQGNSEIEGLSEKVKAYSGSGGRALLKLAIAERLKEAKAKFVVVGSGSSSKNSGIDVNKVDINTLIDQVGLIEGLKGKDTDNNR